MKLLRLIVQGSLAYAVPFYVGPQNGWFPSVDAFGAPGTGCEAKILTGASDFSVDGETF
jgi:hypothetical protein